MKHRLQDGPTIVEVINNPENDYVLLTVSKARYDEDNVQISLSRNIAQALGLLLQ